MKVGCFALIEPFVSLSRQFEAIKEMGIDYADVTDNHNGPGMGSDAGFTAAVCLDAHPVDVKQIAEQAGIGLTAVCAHASLLDPVSPGRYGTHEIVKAIKLAHFLGIDQVVTAEMEPHTEFGQGLSTDEMILIIRSRLAEPIRWAEQLGIDLLLEPHGPITGDASKLKNLLDALGHENTVGVNLDTGNYWLSGNDPADFIKTFGPRIKHVHWKDMPEAWQAQRGKAYGSPFTDIPLGDGLVGIERLVGELREVGFDGPTTLEIVGKENLKRSAERLHQWGAH
jgi:inosose dehydratase